MEQIENLIQNTNERGISFKQLKIKTKLSKRTLNHFIYNSKNIDYANPLLYGSCKNKIHVFIYKPSDTIFRLKNIQKVQKVKKMVNEENLNKEKLNIE